MKLFFLLLLCSAIKVQGSNFNFENAFEDEKMDECPVVYHSNNPVRGIGVPFRSAANNIASTSLPVNSGTARYVNLSASSYNVPSNIIPSYNNPASYITPSYNIPPPQPSPFPTQIHTNRLPTDQNRNILLPPRIVFPTGSPSNSVPVPIRAPVPAPIPASDLLSASTGSQRDSYPIIPLDLENYLKQEMKTYHFRKQDRFRLIRELITRIAKNDYKSYVDKEDEFRAEFGISYNFFKSGCGHYILPYMIYFGATNFVKAIRNRPRFEFDEMKLEKAFKSLIDNKPIETFLTIFRECRWMKENDKKKVSALVKAKYPNLHPLDYMVIELPKTHLATTFDILKILKAPTELEKLVELKDFLIRHHSNFYYNIQLDPALKVLLKIPLMYPEFCQSLPFVSKMLLGEIAVVDDDLEALVQMIQLDESIVLDEYNGGWPLFEIAAISTKNRIIQLMINLVPEIAFLSRPYSRVTPIYKFLIEQDNSEMIKCFEEAKFSSEDKVLNGKNAIQVAFGLGVPKLVRHFAQTLERDKFLGYLMEVYGSEAKIIDHAKTWGKSELVAIIREKLMI